MNTEAKIQNLQGTEHEIVTALWQMKGQAERTERQLFAQGRTAEAEIVWQEVVDICRELVRIGHWKVLKQR